MTNFSSELKKLDGLLTQLGGRKSARKSARKSPTGGKKSSHRRSASRSPHRGGADKDRHFKLIRIDHKDVPVDEQGRYELKAKTSSGKPNQAGPLNVAKKAFNELCRRHKHKSDCHYKFTIQETTQGSSHKEFTYEAKRVPLKKPIVIKDKKTGKSRVFKYEVDIKALETSHPNKHHKGGFYH